MIDKKSILSLVCIVGLAVSLTTVVVLNQKAGEVQPILESQVSSLESQLALVNNEKSILESQVLEFQTRATTLEANNTILLSQISSLQTETTTLKNEVTQSYNSGFSDGEAAGYQKGVIDGANSGYYVRDPTYAEAIAFVVSDQTEQNAYTDNYICMNFVADFVKNSFNAGFRAGVVYIKFPNRYHHGIACFNTLDMGLIFIEPQTDEIVTLTIGEVYYDRTIYDAPYFDDTVLHYVIIW